MSRGRVSPGRGAGGGLTRRALLTTALRGATAAALGAALSACARGAGSAPVGPAPAQTVIALRFMPWWQDWTGSGPGLLRQACDRFEQGHPGLRLTPLPGPNGASGVSSAAVVADILAGQGPDVVCDFGTSFAEYVTTGAFADLSPYLRAAGIPGATWSSAHLEALRWGTGQYGLPTYDGPCVFAYRQDLLAALGLGRPDPDWTYTEAAALWRRCALPAQVSGGAPPRLGATVWWWDGWRASEWLLRGFGGAEMDAAATRATFTDPNSLAAGEWLLPLLWYGVVGTFTAATLQSGSVAFALRGGWSIAEDVVTFGDRFPWDYLPAPVFPQGRSTFGNNDFWGLNALGAHPAAAWELVRYLTYEDAWQRFCMKTALLQPCKNSLWEEWEATMVATAPVLRGKALRWYRDAAQGGYGYAQRFFRYQPVEAHDAIAREIIRLNARQVDVPAAFGAITSAVDALQARGAAVAPAQEAAVRQADALRGGSGPILLDPPPVRGLGTAPTPGGSLLRRSGPAYRLRGAGVDVWGHADNCTFTALAENTSDGDWACRVMALTAGDCPAPAPWAKAGLMARGDLSDDAPMAFVAVTAAHGVQTGFRLTAGYDAAGQTATAHGRSGLVGPGVLNRPNPGRTGNALLRPVWLRLRRQGDQWSAWTSLDGRRFTPAGGAVPVLMAGAWVGLFATAVNAGLPHASGCFIQATFEDLSFTPGATYRLGRP